jgi:hypothetical protein
MGSLLAQQWVLGKLDLSKPAVKDIITLLPATLLIELDEIPCKFVWAPCDGWLKKLTGDRQDIFCHNKHYAMSGHYVSDHFLLPSGRKSDKKTARKWRNMGSMALMSPYLKRVCEYGSCPSTETPFFAFGA